jgi:hypothetical protein
MGHETQITSQGAEQGNVAGTLVPEVKTLPDGDAADAAEAGGQVAYEGGTVDRSQFRRERDGQGGVDSQGAKGAESLGQGLEETRGALGKNNAEWVRMEGDDDGPGTQRPGVENGLTDDVLVSQMDAIEHAQGDADTPEGTTEISGIAEGAHVVWTVTRTA